MPYLAETPHLWIEKLGEQHLEDFYGLWSDPITMQWSSQTMLTSLEEARARLLPRLANKDLSPFAILLKPTGSSGDEKPKMIGSITTLPLGGELAYTINHKYWGQGYMTETIIAVVGPEGVFWDLPERKAIDKLFAQIDPENIGSTKIIQKVGAEEGERRVKSHGLMKDFGEDGRVPEEKLRDLVIWWIKRPATKKEN